jgi:hypothetical protein
VLIDNILLISSKNEENSIIFKHYFKLFHFYLIIHSLVIKLILQLTESNNLYDSEIKFDLIQIHVII